MGEIMQTMFMRTQERVFNYWISAQNVYLKDFPLFDQTKSVYILFGSTIIVL